MKDSEVKVTVGVMPRGKSCSWAAAGSLLMVAEKKKDLRLEAEYAPVPHEGISVHPL